MADVWNPDVAFYSRDGPLHSEQLSWVSLPTLDLVQWYTAIVIPSLTGWCHPADSSHGKKMGMLILIHVKKMYCKTRYGTLQSYFTPWDPEKVKRPWRKAPICRLSGVKKKHSDHRPLVLWTFILHKTCLLRMLQEST